MCEDNLYCSACGSPIPKELVDEVVNETWEGYCPQCDELRPLSKDDSN